MADRGYMIVRITNAANPANPANIRPFIAWMKAERPIAGEMAHWLERGQTMEILEYTPDIDPLDSMDLIPQLNLWRDHLNTE